MTDDGNGRMTTQQLYEAISSLRTEVIGLISNVNSRLDTLTANYPTTREMNACLSSLEAELHGKYSESQVDRQLLRKDLDDIEVRQFDIEKDVRFLKGGIWVVGFFAPVITAILTASITHFLFG